MAFFYDIFFVFISPYFFEESVMVKVRSFPNTPTSPFPLEPLSSHCLVIDRLLIGMTPKKRGLLL